MTVVPPFKTTKMELKLTQSFRGLAMHLDEIFLSFLQYTYTAAATATARSLLYVVVTYYSTPTSQTTLSD